MNGFISFEFLAVAPGDVRGVALDSTGIAALLTPFPLMAGMVLPLSSSKGRAATRTTCPEGIRHQSYFVTGASVVGARTEWRFNDYGISYAKSALAPVREEKVGGRLEKKGSCEDSKRPLPIVILHTVPHRWSVCCVRLCGPISHQRFKILHGNR
jgi:hypothetical protein